MQNKRILLITGGFDSGKTTTLLTSLRDEKYPPDTICGFVSLANAEKTCYRLKDLFSKEERVALDEQRIPFARNYGRFFVDDAVFAWANRQIISRLPFAKLAVFDELGRFELDGMGFDPSFRAALKTTDLDIVATVRLRFLQEVIDFYALDACCLSIRHV